MRNAFAKEILAHARRDPRVTLLMADIGNRLFDAFKDDFPERFFNCGIAEANMVSVAGGLASEGLRPVCYTIASFATYRCYEQIRVDLCYHKQPVVIVGTGAGLSYASLGATHHSCEDVAVMRVLPEMQVLVPADALSVGPCLSAALASERPVYLRIGKKGEPLVYQTPPEVALGGSVRRRSGTDAVILSCGPLLASALAAAALLETQGVDCGVIDCYSVKPLDVGALRRACEEASLLVSLEEHSTVGGFGSAVAEWLASPGSPPVRLLRLGGPDAFLHETSTQATARSRFGIQPEQIAQSVAKALSRI